MSTIQITLKQRLKGFSEADTTSESKGFFNKGDYTLTDYKKEYPNKDTDYAQIETANAGKVWICVRWQANDYAVLKSFPDRPEAGEPGALLDTADLASIFNQTGDEKPKTSNPFDEDDSAVEESAITRLIDQFDDFSYDLKEPAYPFELKGIKVPQTPPNPKQNNCCTFVEGILVKAWADSIDTFDWNNKRHGQMMIYSAEDYFSPITAAVESGMAIKQDDVEFPPKPWTVVQGWKTQWTGGHTFIIVDHHKETDAILTLESNKGFDLNGVGFRKLGMARDFGNKPPENWWERPGLQTWEKMKEIYKFRKMATLKVKNQTWPRQA